MRDPRVLIHSRSRWHPISTSDEVVHRLDEIVAYGLGERVLETYRCKSLGVAEPKRWLR
jgi:hypothetical protein